MAKVTPVTALAATLRKARRFRGVVIGDGANLSSFLPQRESVFVDDRMLTLNLQGDALVALINPKLASYLSASDRIREAAGAHALVVKLNLPLAFAARLDSKVRAAYRRVWRGL